MTLTRKKNIKKIYKLKNIFNNIFKISSSFPIQKKGKKKKDEIYNIRHINNDQEKCQQQNKE